MRKFLKWTLSIVLSIGVAAGVSFYLDPLRPFIGKWVYTSGMMSITCSNGASGNLGLNEGEFTIEFDRVGHRLLSKELWIKTIDGCVTFGKVSDGKVKPNLSELSCNGMRLVPLEWEIEIVDDVLEERSVMERSGGSVSCLTEVVLSAKKVD